MATDHERGPRGKGVRRKQGLGFTLKPEVFAMLADKVGPACLVFQNELLTEGVRPIRGYRGLDPYEIRNVQRYESHLKSLVSQFRDISHGRQYVAVDGWYPETDSIYDLIDHFSVTLRPKDTPVSVNQTRPQFQLRMEAYMGEMNQPIDLHAAGLTRAPERAIEFVAFEAPFLNLSIIEAWKNTATPRGFINERCGAGISFVLNKSEREAYAYGLIHAGRKPALTGRLRDASHKMNFPDFSSGVRQAREATADYYRRKAQADLEFFFR